MRGNLYTKLLSKERRKKTSIKGRSIVIESESDRSRLIFSAPFRRLQQKAQVFSLEANAAVRSRLTHSIEVAQIGRFLADQIVEKLLADKMLQPDQARAFINFVEVACLMHDLGNPPFGHFGEAAISSWFGEHGESHLLHAIGLQNSKIAPAKRTEVQKTLADFIEFDGNCQGLRIATLLQWNDNQFGLNLTFTSIAAYLKYLRAPKFNASKKEKEKLFSKKAGFFSTEKKVVLEMWKIFGYRGPQRFPLAYVMEAADDIAYCISDLEDSLEKGLLNPKIVLAELLSEWEKILSANEGLSGPDSEKITRIFTEANELLSSKSTSAIFTRVRVELASTLTDIACRTYCERHNSVLAGSCPGLINRDTAAGEVLEMLKNYCRTKVYNHISVQRVELAGLTAIRGLLDHFGCILKCNQSRFDHVMAGKNVDATGKRILIEKKLISLFPDKHLSAYKYARTEVEDDKNLNKGEKALLEWNLRAHLITDFISGMTDDFSLSSYQMLSGIKLN